MGKSKVVHSLRKIVQRKKKKKERTREIYSRTNERARLVWRIRSDVALVCYVTGQKRRVITNHRRPLVINYPCCDWAPVRVYLRELYLGILWLTLHIFRPSKISRSMSTSRPRIDSLRSSSTIDHSVWGARAPSPSVSPFVLRRRHTWYWPQRIIHEQFSTTTTGSKVNLPENHALITRKDLRQSITCFEEVGQLFTMTIYYKILMLFRSWWRRPKRIAMLC